MQKATAKHGASAMACIVSVIEEKVSVEIASQTDSVRFIHNFRILFLSFGLDSTDLLPIISVFLSLSFCCYGHKTSLCDGNFFPGDILIE